jgi:hypothetical protein
MDTLCELVYMDRLLKEIAYIDEHVPKERHL